MVSNWPKINDPLVTTVEKFAGDYLNRVSDYFAGVDVGLADANWNPYIITKTKFGNTSLQIADLTASAFYVTIQGRNATLTANKTVQVPDMGATAIDEFLLRTNVAAITGKTFDLASNVLPETGKAAGAILKYDGTEYTGLPRGTANQILVTNSGGTDVAWATMGKTNMPAAVVFTDQQNTYGDFRQEFRSSRVVIARQDGSMTNGVRIAGPASQTGESAIAFPSNTTAGGLFVTDIHAMPLTNKTVDPQVNTLPYVQKYFSVVEVYGDYQCISEDQVDCTGMLQNTQGYGTLSVFGSANGKSHTWTTSTTVNDIAGIVCTYLNYGVTGMNCDPQFRARITLSKLGGGVNDSRMYFGFYGPMAQHIAASDTPLSNTTAGFLIGWRSTDSNFFIFMSNGTAAGTPVDTGLAIATTATFYYLEIKVTGSGTSVTWTIYNNSFTVLATGTQTLNIPVAAQRLNVHAVTQNTTTTAKNIVFNGAWIKATK